MEDGNPMIKILYEDNHLLVVIKEPNIPVQEDSSHDEDFLTMLKNYLKEKYHKPGNVYLGLVHRLDRPVGGIMVFAKTSKCASRLSEQVRTHQFEKTYHAVLMGEITPSCGTLIDFLKKDEKRNLVSVDACGKESILSYQVVKIINHMSLVEIKLKTGRSHQIRVQFSHRGYPLYGDQKYNKNAHPGEQIALFASSLSFYHPVTKEKLTFQVNLPDVYPWSLF